jgi:hypothetical protein
MAKDNDNNDFFPKKILDKLPEGFVESMESADTDEIKQKIVESESHIYEIDKEKENDMNLKKAREEVKNLASAYKDARNCSTAKIKYCIYVLKGRGVNV